MFTSQDLHKILALIKKQRERDNRGPVLIGVLGIEGGTLIQVHASSIEFAKFLGED